MNDARLRSIEDRLDRLENALSAWTGRGAAEGQSALSPSSSETMTTAPVPQNSPSPQQKLERGTIFPTRDQMEADLVTSILGIGGVASVVLAVVYLVRMAYNNGLLTPPVQVIIAFVAGIALIVLGLWWRPESKDRNYASLIPAGGLVIMYLATYAAHIRYQLFSESIALAMVSSLAFAAIGLGHHFKSNLYAFFAVVGTFAIPIAMQTIRGDPLSLAGYFVGWAIIYCAYAIYIGDRAVYLLALFLGLVVFNIVSGDQWVLQAFFQLGQLLIYGCGTVIFTIKNGTPLSEKEAWPHFFGLVLFYAIEYTLFNTHLPTLAPWIAIGSASFVLILSLVARYVIRMTNQVSTALAITYAGIVLFHSIYFELLDAHFKLWAGLLFIPIMYLIGIKWNRSRSNLFYILIIPIAVSMILNICQIMFIGNEFMHPNDPLLATLYAIEFYLAWGVLNRKLPWSEVLLYGGHLHILAAFVAFLDNRLAVSAVWTLIAAFWLTVAVLKKRREIGRSSLLILVFSAGKVFFYDIPDATPLVRILCLVILGFTLYGAGWLYRRLPTT